MTDPELPTRPYLKPWYRLAEDGERVIFEYGQSVVVLEGRAVRRLVPALLPLLDGTRRRDEIVAALGTEVAPAVDHAMRVLAARRLLTDGPPLVDTSAEAESSALFVSATAHASVTPAAAAEVLESSSVAVVGASPAGEGVASLLRRSGVGSAERRSWDDAPAGVDLVVVAPVAAELPKLEGWNRAALTSASPWLQLVPYDGRYASIGPLFVPAETCCHHCFRLRRCANLDFPSEFWAVEQTPAAHPSPPSLDAVAAGLAATLVLRWLAYGDPLVPGRLFALELVPTPAVTTHLVFRVPRCRECSGLEGRAAPLPWYKEDPVVGR